MLSLVVNKRGASSPHFGPIRKISKSFFPFFVLLSLSLLSLCLCLSLSEIRHSPGWVEWREEYESIGCDFVSDKVRLWSESASNNGIGRGDKCN